MKYVQLPDMVSEEVYTQRMSICNSCKHKQTKTDPVIEVCVLCNCPVVNTNKLKSSECPISKWNKMSS